MTEQNLRDKQTGVTLREYLVQAKDGTVIGRRFIVKSPSGAEVFNDGRKNASFITILFCLVTSSAFGQSITTPLPDYDVDRVCEQYYGSHTPQQQKGIKQCVHIEQGGYDSLKYLWYDASERTRKVCLEAVRSNVKPGTWPVFAYKNLADCVIRHRSWDEMDRVEREQGPFRR